MQPEAEAHHAEPAPAHLALAFTEQCWAYWDGQQQQVSTLVCHPTQ